MDEKQQTETAAYTGDYMELARTYAKMGIDTSEKGDYMKARTYYEQALAFCEQAHCGKHPLTGDIYNNIGVTYSGQGDCEEARKCYEKALDIYERAIGGDQPFIASTYANLGSLCHKQGDDEKRMGDYKKALEYYGKSLVNYGKSLDICARIYAPKHSFPGKLHRCITEIAKSMSDIVGCELR